MPLWLAGEPLVLASRSKARQRLLADAGIPIEICAADLDERRLESQASSKAPGVIAAHLARAKATAVPKALPGRLTLGADQVLALGAECFAKPADRTAARAQLRALCGRTHELHSAVAVVKDAFDGTSTQSYLGPVDTGALRRGETDRLFIGPFNRIGGLA